jgi:hypothetical protein
MIMDRKDYILEAHRLLSNVHPYRMLDYPLAPTTGNKIKEITQAMLVKHKIDFMTFKFLQPPTDASHRKFYILPKIHKDKPSWPSKNLPPGRPNIRIVIRNLLELPNGCLISWALMLLTIHHI